MNTDKIHNKRPMEIGSSLLLELSGDNRGYKTSIVGYKLSEYIIIEMPKISGIESKIVNGGRVRGAMVSSGSVVHFECTIINSILKPIRLIFTTFPENIAHRNLRKDHRIECNMPSTIKLLSSASAYAGIITNISSGGCRCFTRAISGGRSQSHLGSKVILVFALDQTGGQKAVCGEILRINPDSKGAFLSIRFCDNDESIIGEINEYVTKLAGLLP